MTTLEEGQALAEEAITRFYERERERGPEFHQDDLLRLAGEVFRVERYEQSPVPGYWLRGRASRLFLPSDLEPHCQLLVS